MAYTREQYNALVAAIASGSEFVKYSDKEVRYRSQAEMLSIKRKMELELGIVTTGKRKTYGVYSKGLANDNRLPAGTCVTVAGTGTTVRGDTFTVWVLESPDVDVVKLLRSGVVIGVQYAVPGANVLTIPYLKSGGIYVETPLFVNGAVRDDINYVQGSGQIVLPNDVAWIDGYYVTIKIEYNA